MSIETTYLLVFLVDSSKINKNNLRTKVKSILAKELPQIQLEVNERDSMSIELSVSGSLENVDACHHKLNKSDELNSENLTRWKDDAGKEIRKQAYPILANIELQLRKFINCAMIEVIGFNWWNSMVHRRIRNRVDEVAAKHKKDSRFHDKIEFTQFDDLIAIVTHSFQEWPENRLISTEDLKYIISDVNSFSELRDEIDKKLSKISLWDDVFSKYFENSEEWKELEKSLLKEGLPLRNKVMHHRPMYLYELKKLNELKNKFNTVLASAKEKLGDEERTIAKRISINIIEMSRKFDELASRFEPHIQAQQEFAEKMESVLRMQQGIIDTISPCMQAQQKIADHASSISRSLYLPKEDESDNSK